MYRNFFKRIIDFTLALIALIVLSPLMSVVAIVTAIKMKGNPFFIQPRPGKNEKIFKLIKFRTMVDNAEDMIASFNPEQKKEWEENFKLKDDPRITKIGKFLRKTSLDELPQLINILKGDMSFVGPRPIVEDELSWYGDNKEKLLSVKPGLTGWWAVNGRSDVPYPERCDFELYYVDRVSFGFDLLILVKTLGAIVRKDGAR